MTCLPSSEKFCLPVWILVYPILEPAIESWVRVSLFAAVPFTDQCCVITRVLEQL